MPRRALTDRMVRQAKPGVLIDGRGLRLRVTANRRSGEIRKSWVLRVTVKGGSVRELGLGSADDISLAEARERASQARKLARDGIDPLAARDADRAARAAEAARAISFRQCAEAYVDAHRAGWKNAKHAAQWSSTLESYVFSVFGDLPVQAVDVALVMKALDPIWKTKTETASRVRQRIEAVLSWAKVRGYRSGENPAQWRGHLEKLLPPRSRVQRVKHHAAMPYAEVPVFMASLGERDSVAASALQFLILTATRTSETINAKWSEINLAEEVWTIPADRMKARREHRVPLSKDAVALLKSVQPLEGKAGWIFPGDRETRPLSNMAFLELLKRMGCPVTAHGFRTSFRVWAAERTNFPRETAEAALAHVLADKVEAAYRRTDLFDGRRKLMEAWARFCGAPNAKGEVVSIASARGRKRAEV
ncbi:MAG: integrase arm-type DNA-binding domain-containing protein [Hyphomonadaceae bacterium]|nr:integrase arm-type DNA-binding domain-containing protein [Hyphomonadaceae bacterium]